MSITTKKLENRTPDDALLRKLRGGGGLIEKDYYWWMGGVPLQGRAMTDFLAVRNFTYLRKKISARRDSNSQYSVTNYYRQNDSGRQYFLATFKKNYFLTA